jgi:uncharacterized protein (TIGR03435 family)
MRRTSAVAGLMSLMFSASNASYGQTPPKLDFEVASVRVSGPHDPNESVRPIVARTGGPETAAPERITYARFPLDLILADAFDVYWDQISGPDWIATQRYDIVANVPAGTTKEQARQMLQNLLVERFHLTVHMQSKVVPGYELTVAEGGSRLKEAVTQPEDASVEPNKDGFPVPPLPRGEHQGRRIQAGHTFLRFADASVSDLASFLSTQLSPGEASVRLSSGQSRGAPTPMLDKTGLKGRYDFTFDYAGQPFFVAEGLPRILSSIKSSLNKQLGLKMVEAKVPVNVLVIDHVDKTPTEN